MAEIRGQPVLGHPWPSPSACFGSNERGFEPFVTAETGRRAWPWVLQDWLPSNFGLAIISTITWLKSAWKARKDDVWHNLLPPKLTFLLFKLGVDNRMPFYEKKATVDHLMVIFSILTIVQFFERNEDGPVTDNSISSSYWICHLWS